MTEESRYGPAVRERTKLLAALLRTPDEKLLTYIQANDLAEHINQSQVRQVRDVMDALGIGLNRPPSDPFWHQLDAVWSLLFGPPGAAQAATSGAHAAAPQPVAAPPAVPPQPVAAPPPIVPPEAAPAPPQPAGSPQPAEPTNEEALMPTSENAVTAVRKRDFRHQVMEDKPPQREPSAPAAPAAPDAWKPPAALIRSPTPGQLQTEARVESNDLKASLEAVRGALGWPLERIAQLCAALANQRAQGEPHIDEICRSFNLPDETILNNVMRLWQRRLDEDQELAREHARLVLKFRQDKDYWTLEPD